MKVASAHLVSIKRNILSHSIDASNTISIHQHNEANQEVISPALATCKNNFSSTSFATRRERMCSLVKYSMPRGFPNIGNNCYLNSLFQSLLSASDLILSALSDKTCYAQHTQKVEQKYVSLLIKLDRCWDSIGYHSGKLKLIFHLNWYRYLSIFSIRKNRIYYRLYLLFK